jgi:hypothetical protein
MGINSVVTPDDLRKTEPVKSGWYPLEIVGYDEQVVKGSDAKPSDGSMNAIYEFQVLEGDPNIKGRKFKKYFNEKSLHFGKELWAVLFPGKFDPKKGGGLTSEMLRGAVGQKLMGYIEKDKKSGYDNVNGFKPLTSK